MLDRFENFKLWFPLFGILAIFLFFISIRGCRIYKLKKTARAHFLRACNKKSDEATCSDKLGANHATCFEMTRGLMRTGFRSSRVTVDLKGYTRCVHDIEAYKESLKKKRRRRRR